MVSQEVMSLVREAMPRLQADPELFFTHILGIPPEYIWDKMQEVMLSVRDNSRTAVKAGHSVSKSFTAARLALWFLYSYGPDATVITTAPTDNQVENVLWREIRDAHQAAPYKLVGNKPLTKQLNVTDQFPKWFALGFSTRPDTVTAQATAFQGFHNNHVLVIFDEAAGIIPQIWEAAEALMTSGHCRFLVIGNPTSSYGNFVECFKPDSGYNCITISVLDTPNYKQERDVIPGLAGRAFERRIREKYGEKSSFYLSRVLGEIPEVVEGAIYAKELVACRQDGRLVDHLPHDKSCLVHTAWDIGVGDQTAIWFFRVVGPEIHILDYYEQAGEGLTHYIEVLHHKRDDSGWLYGQHFAPHDIKQREMSSGNALVDTARKLGIDFTVLERGGLEEGIECGRQTFWKAWFDKSKCGLGLKSLAEYHWKTLETMSTVDKPVYSRIPEHDWSSHGADAWRYLSVAYQHGLVTAQKESISHQEWSDYYSRVG